MRTKMINHLTCEVLAVLKFPCADISINVIRQKAFSTCSAHLTVMIVLHRTILFTYGKPKSMGPLREDKHDFADKLISIFYRVVTPMLNTIIYIHPEEQAQEGCCEKPGISETPNRVTVRILGGQNICSLSTSLCSWGNDNSEEGTFFPKVQAMNHGTRMNK
ncbi:olfactory receptor 13C7-like [Sapajus apella]|uniref:Olfactory receptor 13C7-like n=1 Tax=Sapajus apella TaxID=9515 RepID=A0A6J3EU48_SAPAP|nr:olfactory receptor 13C7-like [Sapajus apella]